MKQSAIFLGSSVFLTLVFYVVAYYFQPTSPPQAPLMALFAGVALVLVWLGQMVIRKIRSKKKPGGVVLLILSASLLGSLMPRELRAATQATSSMCKFNQGPLAGKIESISASAPIPVGSSCTDGNGSSGTIVAPTPPASRPSHGGAAPPPSPKGTYAAETDSADTGDVAIPSARDSLPRVTGNALLLHKVAEEPGYGLYSYALLTHAPLPNELPQYKGFLRALIALPAASEVADSVPKRRINITYLLVTSLAGDWGQLSTDGRTDYVLAHYDWARSAAISASLPQQTGRGPVIVSTLSPIAFDRHPRPVLVQDLSAAQSTLMADYVSKFTIQVSHAQFWQASAMGNFALGLRNLLETAANGLGMSQDAVKSWIQFFK